MFLLFLLFVLRDPEVQVFCCPVSRPIRTKSTKKKKNKKKMNQQKEAEGSDPQEEKREKMGKG